MNDYQFTLLLTPMLANRMNVITAFDHKVQEIDTLWITLKDGCKLAARVWLPENASEQPVPAILEYLPYRRRDGTIERDELTHAYYAGHGYACLRVDMRGTGDSDGLLHDEYTQQELDDALEVINWITQQAWCSGNVGMMGISWGGFNSLQVAALQPDALKAIVTLCSTDDRYATDIHYKGGALLLENLGWASTMLSYQSRPPNPEVVGESWKAMWLERLENMPLLLKTWLEHQSRDAYWQHGSICEDYSAVNAATLAVGGWCDAYSNTVLRLIENLDAPTRGIVGPWAHKYPHFAIPKPQIGFLQESLRWWDKWLKGVETNVLDDPLIRLYKFDSSLPQSHYEHLAGDWLEFDAWPPKEVQSKSLYLATNELKDAPTSQEHVSIQSAENTGTQSGEFCIIWLGPEWPLDQRPDDAQSVIFEKDLTHDLSLVGACKLRLRLKSQSEHANLAVRLIDVHPDGQSTRMTYGILNLSQRNSHENPEALPINDWVNANIQLDDIAYTIPKGHKLRLSLSSAYYPLIWPSKDKAKLTLDLSQCKLELPELSQSVAMKRAFPPAESATPADIEIIRPAKNEKTITHDVVTNSTTTRISDDYGRYTIKRYKLTAEESCQERYTIQANDPLNAVAKTQWKQTLERDDWNIHTESSTQLSCDSEYFYIKAELKAFEANELIFEKHWSEKVKRGYL